MCRRQARTVDPSWSVSCLTLPGSMLERAGDTEISSDRGSVVFVTRIAYSCFSSFWLTRNTSLVTTPGFSAITVSVGGTTRKCVRGVGAGVGSWLGAGVGICDGAGVGGSLPTVGDDDGAGVGIGDGRAVGTSSVSVSSTGITDMLP